MPHGADPTAVKGAITRVLGPYIGPNTAAASAQMFIKKLGADVTTIGEVEAAQLVKWIGPGVKVFVGAARADQVVLELRAALNALLEGP